jgi:hypothetical protein
MRISSSDGTEADRQQEGHWKENGTKVWTVEGYKGGAAVSKREGGG